MGKKFREWAPDQTWVLPPSPRDWLDYGHPAYFLLDVVGEVDLSPFFERYKTSITEQPPFHPRMMRSKTGGKKTEAIAIVSCWYFGPGAGTFEKTEMAQDVSHKPPEYVFRVSQ
ncbi:MAG: hypothetical protein AB8G99_27600 [Planctomycetaceae bacterium]